MSTRGCIAVGSRDCWTGVYNHWDNYPTGRGPELWEILQKYPDLEKFKEELLSYDDWQAFRHAGVCQYCGQKKGQPHTIVGCIPDAESLTTDRHGFHDRLIGPNAPQKIRKYWLGMPWAKKERKAAERNIKDEQEIARDFKKTGFPDPKAKRHQHNEGKASDHHLSNLNIEGSWVEWVYVVDPEKRVIHILASVKKGFEKMATVKIDGPEPNWKAIEKEREKRWNKAA